MRALLIGDPPDCPLDYTYVTEGAYDALVIGSLTYAQLMGAIPEVVWQALAQGIPVVLYEPGLPKPGSNRALAAKMASCRRELKNLGVVTTSGDRKNLITAREAKALVAMGKLPAPGAVMTPLAKEILEGLQ